MSKQDRINEQIEEISGYGSSAASDIEDASYEISRMDDINLGDFDYHADFTARDEVTSELDNVTKAIDSLMGVSDNLNDAVRELENGIENLEEVKRALEELVEIYDEEPDIEVGQIVRIDNDGSATYEVIAVMSIRNTNWAWLKPRTWDKSMPETAPWSDLEIQE